MSDVDEVNFDIAFDLIRPVVQGMVDIGKVLTEDGLQIILAAVKPTPAPSTIPKAPVTGTSASIVKPIATKPSELGKKNTVNMYIQPIYLFKGTRRSTTLLPGPAAQTNGAVVPMSPTTTANRLNVNASLFRPNPKGPTSPIPSSMSASTSPKAKPTESSPPTPNPFFGTKIMKNGVVHIKDDFNSFKHNKVDVSTPFMQPMVYPPGIPLNNQFTNSFQSLTPSFV
ncbi:uncharacterized protein F5147DRAFT_798856 [Suillus discolor]|uniref:Uncharacterized protein n=1 Tax=Suillus discolor TaxID=1912936 RepID=A0A9P7F8V8_9AGAM|nr:uncharacterized protein F5147DRAFT_798856 [Suillus discolor]KAG2108906.1 hypothetical protein F5147DRAFT_798856 [Suillus discolor]